MSPSEAAKTIKELQHAMPSLAEWLAKLPSQAETLKLWAATFTKIDFADAATVITKIVDGEIEVRHYDYERLPGIMKRNADDARRTRTMLAPVDTATLEDEPRYDCPLCCDSGRVIVAHHRMVRAYLTGGIEAARRCSYHTESALCSCRRGSQMRIDRQELNQSRRKEGGTAQLGDKSADPLYRITYPSPPSEAFFDAFAKWCDEQRATANTQEHFDERYVWKP